MKLKRGRRNATDGMRYPSACGRYELYHSPASIPGPKWKAISLVPYPVILSRHHDKLRALDALESHERKSKKQS